MNFATPAAIFVSSFIIALSGALMPGPLLAVTVRDATRRGFIAAPLLVLGHGILEILLVVLLLFGLAEWVKGEAAATVIALAGSAALIWMAWGMIREIRVLRFAAGGDGMPQEFGAGDGKPAGLWRPIADGVVASISNPYWSLWWATIGLGYLALSRGQGIVGVAFFFAGHILADAAWFLFVGLTVSMGRGRFTDRLYRGIVGVCAGFLFFFALSF
ncbi:MAG: LysE family transporter, partial [Deltaproteobacteria bacterium]|nr:LysE family transporter [Deltaproteobacteria bacterium]